MLTSAAARVGASIVVATFLVAAVALEHVRALAAERMLELSDPLLAYAGATRDGGLQTLLFNGARLRMRSGTTDDSIDELLDAQAELCRSDSEPSVPLLRSRSDDQAFIGCIVARGGGDLLERVQAFGKTADLAELGELRFTWAMRREHETRYVMIASDGSLELLRMFPLDTDVRGADVAGVARPPRAQRIISSQQQGAEPLLVSYRSALALEQLEAEYTRLLVASGSAVEPVPRTLLEEPALIVKDKHGVSLVLLAPDGEGSLISIVPLSSNDATHPSRAR